MLSSLPLTLLLSSVTAVLAATVTYDFNITWTTANPDGLFPRRTIGINGKWPIPTIEVSKGDRLIVNMYNGLGDQNTSLHFHGIFQNGTSYMDGPVEVTQCPVAPGQSFKYDFVVSVFIFPIPNSQLKAPLKIGESTRNLLVSLSHKRPISRRPSWSTHSA